jgi:hypothetical protein
MTQGEITLAATLADLVIGGGGGFMELGFKSQSRNP